MLSAVILSAIMLSTIILSVVMLNVVAPFRKKWAVKNVLLVSNLMIPKHEGHLRVAQTLSFLEHLV